MPVLSSCRNRKSIDWVLYMRATLAFNGLSKSFCSLRSVSKHSFWEVLASFTQVDATKTVVLLVICACLIAGLCVMSNTLPVGS